LRRSPRERVLAAAAADDEYFHDVIVPRERTDAASSMTEVPHAGEHHRDVVLVRRAHDFLVA
jgi:hypothetical protein